MTATSVDGADTEHAGILLALRGLLGEVGSQRTSLMGVVRAGAHTSRFYISAADDVCALDISLVEPVASILAPWLVVSTVRLLVAEPALIDVLPPTHNDEYADRAVVADDVLLGNVTGENGPARSPRQADSASYLVADMLGVPLLPSNSPPWLPGYVSQLQGFVWKDAATMRLYVRRYGGGHVLGVDLAVTDEDGAGRPFPWFAGAQLSDLLTHDDAVLATMVPTSDGDRYAAMLVDLTQWI